MKDRFTKGILVTGLVMMVLLACVTLASCGGDPLDDMVPTKTPVSQQQITTAPTTPSVVY